MSLTSELARNLKLAEEAAKYGIPEDFILKHTSVDSLKGVALKKLNNSFDKQITKYAKQGYGLTKGNVHPTKPNKSLLSNARYRQAATPQWSDVGVEDYKDEIEALIKKNPGSKFQVDHDLPIKAKSGGKRVASGLNVFDNMSPMEASLNNAKRNNVPEEFLENIYKQNPQTGRLDGFNNAGLKVPRSQAGFMDPDAFAETFKFWGKQGKKALKNIDLRSPATGSFLRGLGKVGLLGGGEMLLNAVAPDNPLNQARQRGHGMLGDLGLDLQGSIDGIESTPLRHAAMLGEGMFLDPFVTALGAGANMGDRLYGEITGENIRPNITRQGPGLAGRFNKKGML